MIYLLWYEDFTMTLITILRPVLITCGICRSSSWTPKTQRKAI